MFDFLIKLLSYFKHLYAEICLGVLTMPLVPNGEIANVAASILIDEEWENVEFQNKFLIVTTKSEQLVVFWNANKYYAWMSTGSIQKGNYKICWDDQIPDVYSMLCVKRKLDEYVKNDLAKKFL